MMITTHIHLVIRLRMSECYSATPACVLVVIGNNCIFTLFVIFACSFLLNVLNLTVIIREKI